MNECDSQLIMSGDLTQKPLRLWALRIQIKAGYIETNRITCTEMFEFLRNEMDVICTCRSDNYLIKLVQRSLLIYFETKCIMPH